MADSNGDGATAVALQAKAVELLSARSGDSPRLAVTINNLGTFRKNSGDYTGALAAYRDAEAMYTRLFGETHPDLALTLSGMAGIEDTFERRGAACPLWERALRLREAKLGPDHLLTVYTRAFLAQALRVDGDLTSARDVATTAVAGGRELLARSAGQGAVEQGSLAAGLIALGRVEAAAGRTRQAEAAFNETIDMMVRSKREDDDHTMAARLHLGRLLLQQGRLREARVLIERAARALETNLRDPVRAIEATIALGDLAAALGAPADARERYQRAITTATRVLGADHPVVGRAAAAADRAAKQQPPGQPSR